VKDFARRLSNWRARDAQGITVPDFECLLSVLRGEVPARPTLFEFFLNERLYGTLAGRPQDPADARLGRYRWMLEAFAAAGYDYCTTHGCDFRFAVADQPRAASISQNEGAMIRSRADFEQYDWPDPDRIDYDRLGELGEFLPAGLKLIVHGPSGVLENTIRLVGYEPLCLLIYDDPELAKDVFDAVGSRLVRHYERALQFDTVGAIIGNDDWGHKTQTMLPPAVMREYVFPWHAKIVAAAHTAGRPAILHSCGNRREILDDIVAMGYDAVHSYEDLILPVEDAYEQYHGRVAVLGGIDVDFLCRSTPEAIRARCEAMLDRVADRGGYALGSGNSIPYYVPDESFFAMIRCATAHR